VAFNIGGSTTGPAFGPAIGADAVSKTTAGAPIAATIGSFVILAGGPATLSSPARPVVTRRAR
jgi:phosphate/sulfate permease